jgi:syntaxin 5
MVVQRDRSLELQQYFDSLRGQSSASPSSVVEAPVTVHPDVNVFNEFAQAFAKEIASLSSNIMNLAKITQQQSVFEEDSQEISALTTVVKTQLQRLHNDMDTLAGLKEHAMRSQRGSSFFSSNAQKEAERHTSAVVDTLKGRLANTGQQFKSVLQSRKDNLKDTALRRNQFTSDRSTTFESALFRDQQSHEQQQMLMNPSNTQYYRQRADAVREIEAAVNEVGELFHDFTRLVHEQDELVVRIDSNVDDALRDVNAGSNELMRYLASLSSNRGLILKVFGVLFVFLIFFGFIVVR